MTIRESLLPMTPEDAWATNMTWLVIIGSIFYYITLPFVTIYIYLGVAAIIGLVTGSILHISSTILVSLFNLASSPAANRVPLLSREQVNLEEAWSNSSYTRDGTRSGAFLEKRFAEWQKKDGGPQRDDGSLFAQTILEEDDDSDE
ncbi:hypothetical protein B0O99DRAFT_684084 [Bisporella sp. PMI_857]|nr:hypothetical protein B0O99DRAFT_684084 [Bisporella sp. PMI_857]